MTWTRDERKDLHIMQTTLCTFHCGNPDSLVVLGDWIRFVGQPQLPVLVSTIQNWKGNFGKVDVESMAPGGRILELDPGGLGIQAFDPAAIFETIEQVQTEWVLLIKLDTLPYALAPNPNFLKLTVEQIACGGLWGGTGSFIPCDLQRNVMGHPVTMRYSNNYSLFRRDAWLRVFSEYKPEFIRAIRDRNLTPSSRFVTESTIESYLKSSGNRLLFLEDSSERSVFHINQWGDKLDALRDRYLSRTDVEPYLNRFIENRREPWEYPLWERYYGWPKPGAVRRFRIWAGRARSRIVGGKI